MGVKGLNTLIKNTTTDTISYKLIKDYSGCKIAIDTHFYIYKFLMNKGNHIDGLFKMIVMLLNSSIIPIFVYDGETTDLKEETLEERREEKKKLSRSIDEIKKQLEEDRDKLTAEEIEKLEKELEQTEGKLVYINKKIIGSSKKLMELMGVKYIEANGEAEILCSKLSKYGLVDYVLTDDTDAIPFGSKRILRELNMYNGSVLEYNINKVMYQWRLPISKIIELSILLGNDYNERPKGIYPEYALELIKKGRTIETLGWIKLEEEEKKKIEQVREYYSKYDKKYVYSLEKELNKTSANLIELRRWLGENSSISSKEYNSEINRVYFRVDKSINI